MRAGRGVTLVELLGVIGALACLTALAFPVLMEVKEAADRRACAANLFRLGEAMWLYAGDFGGYLPDCGAASPLGGRVPSDGRHFSSRFDAPGTCAWPHVRAVGNQANLWLLVRAGYAAPRLFICPATADRPSLNAADDPAVMGFLAMDPATAAPIPAEDHFLRHITGGRCSYSYQNQLAHPETGVTTASGLATTHRLLYPSSLVVLADRNPYTRPELTRQPIVSPAEEPEANSLNHNGRGQNVLYLGGHVEWHETPRCGPVREDGLRDNIYRPDAGEPDDPENVPRSMSDSFLAP